MLEATRYAESISARNAETLSGQISVAAPHGIGEMVLPRILLRFRKRHPHVSFSLSLNDQFVSPIAAGADISVRLGDQPEPDCIDEQVGFVKRALVASSGYLAEYGEPTTPEALVAHPFMRVDGIFADEHFFAAWPQW